MSDFQGANRPNRNSRSAAARTAQDKAGEGAGLVGDKAAEVAGTAKEQVANVAGEAGAQARDLAGQLRGRLQDQAQSQTQRLAENVHRLADELREMGESGQSDSRVAGAVRQIADGGHQVASRLERRGPDGLLGDLQDFARRRPGVFLAGAALAGFAVARAGKGVSAAGSSGSSSSEASGVGQGTVRPIEPTRSAMADARQAGYEDPGDTYGQSQPPHVTPRYGPGATAAGPMTPPAPPQRPTQGG